MDEAALKAMFEKENVDAVIHCAALKAVGECRIFIYTEFWKKDGRSSSKRRI